MHPGSPGEGLALSPEAQQVLVDAACRLLASAEPQPIIRQLFESVSTMLGCEMFLNFVVAEESLCLREHHGLSEKHALAFTRIPLDQEPCGLCASTGEFIYFDATELATHPLGATPRSLGARCYVCAPLVSATGIRGTLTLLSRTRTSFEPAELIFIRTVGRIVGAALEREGAVTQQRRTESRMRLFLDQASDAIFLLDETGEILDTNQQACDALGYDHADLVGRKIREIETGTSREDREQAAELLRHGVSLAFDSFHRRRDGTVFPVELRVRPFQEGGRLYALAVARDITERKRADELLRDSEATLRRAQLLVHVGSWTFDVGRSTVRCTRESQDFCGLPRPESTEEEMLATVHPEDRARVTAAWRKARAGAPFSSDHRLLVDGVVRHVVSRGEAELDHNGRVVRITGVTQDVTAQRKMEMDLRHARSMELLGQLAAGIAHDFGNLLMLVNGTSESLLAELPPRSPVLERIRTIMEAGRRAATLTHQLLAFGSERAHEPVELDLNRLVEGALGMVRRMIANEIAVRTELSPDLWRVFGDPGQLDRVIVNLLLNARDAIPSAGRIEITTSNRDLAPGEIPDLPYPPRSRWVVLEVRDSGEGMPPEVRERAFEPYYTTKGPEKGVGLGLSTAHSIVANGGGFMQVESEVGKGSTFRVFLPAHGPAPAVRPAEPPKREEKAGETILVVEDEEGVLSLFAFALGGQGYRVLQASSARTALDVAEGHAEPIHLLLSDVVLPDMDGCELARRLQDRYPGLRVVFMSGYTEDTVFRDRGRARGHAFLEKPFLPNELLLQVRRALDAPP